MEKGLASALIIAKPGPLRDGLYALMTAMPQIGIVYGADDVASALRITWKECPVLVLLDHSTNNGVQATIRRAKTTWPQALCVFLASDVQQHREAEAAGADAVLLKGFPAAKLATAITKLLPGYAA